MRIFKYQLEVADNQIIEMHPGEILKVGTQRDTICIWALVDDDAPRESRQFAIVGTGHKCPWPKEYYLGTVGLLGDMLIYHVFDVTPFVKGVEPTEEEIAWADQITIEEPLVETA